MPKEIGTYEKSIPLGVRSKYSLLDGLLTTSSPDALFQRAQMLGYPAMSIPDTNWFGAAEISKGSENTGIKNIIGITLPYTIEAAMKPHPITLLPRTTQAVSEIFGLYSQIRAEGELLTPNKIARILDDGNTIALFEGNPEEPTIREHLAHPNAFWAIKDPSHQQRTLARRLAQNPKTAESVVIAHDMRMANPLDHSVMRFLIQTYPQSTGGLKIDQLLNYTLQHPLLIASIYNGFPQGFLARSLEISQEIDATYPRPKDIKANSIPEDWEGTSFEYLNFMINNITEELILEPDLHDRVNKELELIDRFHFADYLFISREIIDFCQKEGIEHTVTGSANHSLVAHLMGITKVDPTNLNYQVFLKEEREKDLPDIDIKIDSRFLAKVKNFLIHSYPEHAVFMSQVGVMRKGTVNNLIKDHNIKLSDEEKERVLQAELPFKVQRHSSGILMAKQTSPIQLVANNFISPWTTQAVEILELPNKFDILSSIGHERIGRTKELLEKQGERVEIPYDDPETLAYLFSHLPKIGIAEAESPHAESWFRKIGHVVENPNLYHVAMVLAIMRPATQKQRSDLLEYYEFGESPFKEYEEIEELLGKIVYVLFYKEQEQELEKLIVEHANDYPKEVLQNLQNMVNSFTGYSYKEGHALAYAQLVYEQAYLTTHHPREFWTAVIQSIAYHGSGGNYPKQTYINEALRFGIQLLLPDPNNIPQMPELIDEGIVVGSDLMEKTQEVYRKYREMLKKYTNAISHQEQINLQLQTFGVCFTANPINRYSPEFHFNPQLDRQTIIGAKLNERTVNDFLGNQVVLITLDSEQVIHASVPQEKYSQRVHPVKKGSNDLKISIEYNPYTQTWEII